VIDDNALLEYFQRGLIPGPEESEEAFLQRVNQAKPLSHAEWSGLPSLFGVAIDWVPISYSNHQIAWWEGAATWISEDQLPSIQLRIHFQKGSFLGYSRNEVLSHEAIHAARMRFEEPQFEEVLAYATAPRAWKRFFGPLFSRTWEPLVLMLGVLLGTWRPEIPLLMIGLSLGWLMYRQWIFKRCCRKLSLPAVLCLTDVEMKKLAWMSDDQIQAYLEKGSTLLIRLRRRFWDRNRKRGGRL
jgi:hypothetical protein